MYKKDLSVVISGIIKEFNFSFDEVVLVIQEAINQGGTRRVTELIFEWIGTIIYQHYHELVIPKMDRPCCDTPYWLKHARSTKTVQTGLGKLKINTCRMKCHNCESTHSPFNIFFDLSKRSWSYELEKSILESVKDQSYRRSVKELNRSGVMQVNKNLIWRMAINSDFMKQDLKVDTELDTIIADGTGYKPHSDDSKKELKIVLGMKGIGLVPIGAWVRSNWRQIGREIKKANYKNKKLKFKPIANVLVSDGDRNLIKGLKQLAYHEQRCQWHLVRDFKYAYLYQDEGGTKDEWLQYKKQLWELLQKAEPESLELNNLSHDEASLTIMREVWLAEKELSELEEKLQTDNFSKAATYLRNAREQLFTHLRFLIKTGEEVPKVTSRIERFMRELGRRMKRIAHNWSEAGAEAMARILLQLTLNKEGWDKYWGEKMKISGNFNLNVKIVHST